jgi:hypothetical protein
MSDSSGFGIGWDHAGEEEQMIKRLTLMVVLLAVTPAQALESPQAVTPNRHSGYTKQNKEPCKIDWKTRQVNCQDGKRNSTGRQRQSQPTSQSAPWWRRWWPF